MTGILSTRNCWWDRIFRQGWERQPGEGGALWARGARRHRRQEVTPEPRARRARRAGYSVQPVKAAKAPTSIEAPVASTLPAQGRDDRVDLHALDDGSGLNEK